MMKTRALKKRDTADSQKIVLNFDFYIINVITAPLLDETLNIVRHKVPGVVQGDWLVTEEELENRNVILSHTVSLVHVHVLLIGIICMKWVFFRKKRSQAKSESIFALIRHNFCVDQAQFLLWSGKSCQLPALLTSAMSRSLLNRAASATLMNSSCLSPWAKTRSNLTSTTLKNGMICSYWHLLIRFFNFDFVHKLLFREIIEKQ